MMSLGQHLLGLLAEECSEVQKIAFKAQRFGLEEHHPDHPETNREKLFRELDDLMAAVAMLNDVGVNYKPDPVRIAVKKAKVVHYMKYSVELGQVDHKALREYEND